MERDWHFRKDHRLTTGVSETGKTTLWVEQLTAPGWKWIFVFDPDREFAHRTGFPVSTTPAQMIHNASTCRVVCYDPSQMFGADLERGFAFFCRFVMDACKNMPPGLRRVGIDEIWKFTSNDEHGIPDALKEIMSEGRKFQIHTRIISQSVNEVHSTIRKQLDFIYTFRHNEPLSLRWLKDRGFDPDAVSTLPEAGVYLCRNLRLGVTDQGGKFDPAKSKAKRNR